MYDEEPFRDPHDEYRFKIERLQAENAALRMALEFYANLDSWMPLQSDNNIDDWSAIDETDTDRSCGGNVPFGGRRARALLAQFTTAQQEAPDA